MASNWREALAAKSKHRDENCCPRCQEDRLIERVEDARGAQDYCKVCGFSWWIDKK